MKQIDKIESKGERIMDFKKLILSEEYDFLRNDEHLSGRIALLTLGGSYAYGTNKTDGTSDVDVRGCALEKPSDLIGFSKFEQVINYETDTTIYAFNKLVNLLLEANPNTIEILGCKPEHYLYVSKEGRLLLDNKKAFLSKKVLKSFSGYAMGQLGRLNNALARDRMSQSQKENHILNSLKSAMLSFDSRYTYFENGAISLYTDKSNKSGLETELFIDINLLKYPLRDIAGILDEMHNIVRLYEKVNHRNKKKDEEHLDKHAMHLIRLYLMAIDILENQDIITYRGNDLDLLLGIRHGKYRMVDGNYHTSFFEMLEVYKNRLEYAIKHTELPNEPNYKLVEEIVMTVNKSIITER